MLHEVVARQPRATLRIDVQVRERGGRFALREQRADRLTFVRSERGDVGERLDVGKIRTERGDDLSAVGVTRDNRRALLEREDLP